MGAIHPFRMGGAPDECAVCGQGRSVHKALSSHDVPKVAGMAVKAHDTGRVLMLQRSNSDKNDPARGTWEFPGGHIEKGEDPQAGAIREWEEETGSKFPTTGRHAGSWTSPNGVYRGHVYVVPSEDHVPINLDPRKRKVFNPDDPDHDDIETAAWFDPKHLRHNPAVRPEVRHSTDWSVIGEGKTPRFTKALPAFHESVFNSPPRQVERDTCPECGQPVTPEDTHCPRCGFPLLQEQVEEREDPDSPASPPSPMLWRFMGPDDDSVYAATPDGQTHVNDSSISAEEADELANQMPPAGFHEPLNKVASTGQPRSFPRGQESGEVGEWQSDRAFNFVPKGESRFNPAYVTPASADLPRDPMGNIKQDGPIFGPSNPGMDPQTQVDQASRMASPKIHDEAGPRWHNFHQCPQCGVGVDGSEHDCPNPWCGHDLANDPSASFDAWEYESPPFNGEG